MCFNLHATHRTPTGRISKVPPVPPPQVAKRNITVYKTVRKKSVSDKNGTLLLTYYESEHQHYRYIFNQQHYADFKTGPYRKSLERFEINEGLHSFIARPAYAGSLCILRCVIPKGAQYYKDKKEGVYVSNRLIINTEV